MRRDTYNPTSADTAETSVIQEGLRTLPTTTSAGTVTTSRIGSTYENPIRNSSPAIDPP